MRNIIMEKSNCYNKSTQEKNLCDSHQKTVENMFDEEWASFDMDECRDVDRDLIKQHIATHYIPRQVVEAEMEEAECTEPIDGDNVDYSSFVLGCERALQDLKQSLTNK